MARQGRIMTNISKTHNPRLEWLLNDLLYYKQKFNAAK